MAFSTVFDKYSPQPIKNIKCELHENLICYFFVVFKIVEVYTMYSFRTYGDVMPIPVKRKQARQHVFFLWFLHCWGTELCDVGCFVVFE